MVESTTTNTNPFIDLSHHVWGWEIPVYLFLGGLVAGMMLISGYFLFSGRWRRTDSSCFIMPGLSLVLLSIGMLALFLDLEHKPFVWRLYLTFQVTSPMSWGSWILVLVYPALVANFLLRVPAPIGHRLPALSALSERLIERPAWVSWIGAVNMILGGMLGIYTGILLSALGARPLWSSALLGPLFLVSGLSTAAAFVHMVAREREERELLAKADIGFILVELLFIGLFLIGLLSATRSAHPGRSTTARRVVQRGVLGLRRWSWAGRAGDRPTPRSQAPGPPYPGGPTTGHFRWAGAAFRHRVRGAGRRLDPGLSSQRRWFRHGISSNSNGTGCALDRHFDRGDGR